MSVVELDRRVVGELGPRFLKLPESTANIAQGRSSPEVLLFQSQFLSFVGVVVGVEYSSDLESSHVSKFLERLERN